MPKTIIFDFDGTIADTLESGVNIYNNIAPWFNVLPMQTEEREHLRSLGARQLMKEHRISRFKLPFLLYLVRKQLRREMHAIKPIKGMETALNELKSRRV